jgi:hypothetical protein
MRSSIVAIMLAGTLLVAAPALGQQPETGPATTKEPPLRGKETGTRGPSGGSPETGYHGPRDVTKDAEPGKEKSAEEKRQMGLTGQDAPSKKN